MRWYDLFAYTYDLQLEATYRPWREIFVREIGLKPGDRVVDLGCGTGQNFDLLVEAVGPTGQVVGLDASSGMLKRARARIEREGWSNVSVQQADLLGTWPDLGTPDAMVGAMVFSALPAEGFDLAWAALAPGGRFAILDAFASTRTFQTRMVEWIAQADLDRRTWEALEACGEDVQHRVLDAPASVFGGELYTVWGRKPEAQTSSSS